MTSIAARGRLLTGLGICLGAGVLAALPAAPAQACGGLFCSAATPVNQAAERIIFAYDKPNKQVTAVVEILYQGPAEKFAWVLPVPGIPKVAVSTSAVLDRLQAATNPTYSIQRSWADQCGGGNGARPSGGGTGGSGGGFAGGPGSAAPAACRRSRCWPPAASAPTTTR